MNTGYRMSRVALALSLALGLGIEFVPGYTHLFASSGPEPRPDLAGQVRHADGSPVPKATVFIYTAGPKTGSSSFCPSCYPDCAKRGQTAADGKFRIESLDPKLLFKLLAVAGGHEPLYVSKVDPSAGPVDIVLKPLDPAALASKSRIAGMVMDEAGEPVPGAIISPEGVRYDGGTRYGGIDEFIDPVAVSDEHGFFLLPCRPAVQKAHAIVEARGQAKRRIDLSPGQDHIVRMVQGVSVHGTVTRDGKPLKDVVMAMATVERFCETFLRDFEAVTDKDGHFLIMNVTPGREYNLFAKRASLAGRGAVETRVVRAGDNGSVLDAGELKALPGFRVKGRLVLSDGKPVPAGTQLFFGYEDTWDPGETPLDERGQFELLDLVKGAVSITARVKGYKFSKTNPSLDWLNGGIVGRIDGSIENLTLLMEPGEWSYDSSAQADLPPGREAQPTEKALRGAERPGP